MQSTKISTVILLSLFFPMTLFSQSEKVDLEMIYKIKQMGLSNSTIEDMVFWMTDFAGPRLVGSTGNARANDWAKKKMEEIGLRNVRTEQAAGNTRGGWDNLKCYAAMSEPYYVNFACNPVAWTGSTNGVIRSEVILIDVKDENDLEQFRGKLSGKIVLLPSVSSYEISFNPLASRLSDEQLKNLFMAPSAVPERRPLPDFAALQAQRALRVKINDFIKMEKAALILNGSGVFNVPRSNGANYTAGEKEPIAELNLPVEDHGRMERLLKHNVQVKMEVEITNRFFESPYIYNVIGDIPGTDEKLKDEIVMVGAHIDSWHGGTGAADNASGCAVMLEAMRILKSLDISPRRTIRIALWGGEEQGLYGSKGYAGKYLVDPKTKDHKPGFDKFAAYFNMDNGTGKYRGIYAQENDMVRPVFEEWLKPFEDMGCSLVTNRRTSGTDHLSFDEYGLPAFQFVQDGIEYGRGYHTVMDTYERLIMADLRHNAVITASFIYNAAMRDEKLPRKPLVLPTVRIR
jgi:hypothetical protein